ncbi:MAG: hypothetical protein WCQ99_16290 [Pseudomonadota bacterium]
MKKTEPFPFSALNLKHSTTCMVIYGKLREGLPDHIKKNARKQYKLFQVFLFQLLFLSFKLSIFKNITAKSHGTGNFPMRWEVVGQGAQKNYEKDQLI